VCAGRHAQLAAPLVSQFFFLVLCLQSGDTGLVWISRNPGVFAFLNFIRLVGASSLVERIAEHKDIRGKEVADQEDMGFSPNSTSNNRQDKTRRFNSPHFNILPSTNHGLCSFSCSVCLSWASLGRERAMTSQLFCLFSWRLETYKAGVGTTNTPLRLNKTGGDWRRRGKGLNR
jgi:hypothetical protein